MRDEAKGLHEEVKIAVDYPDDDSADDNSMIIPNEEDSGLVN